MAFLYTKDNVDALTQEQFDELIKLRFEIVKASFAMVSHLHSIRDSIGSCDMDSVTQGEASNLLQRAIDGLNMNSANVAAELAMDAIRIVRDGVE